jgi:hypothetical protein
LVERVERLRVTRQLIDGRQRRIKNALRKHTHSHVKLQSGAKIWATAKPENKRNVASGAARGDIALWVVRLEEKKKYGVQMSSKVE